MKTSIANTIESMLDRHPFSWLDGLPAAESGRAFLAELAENPQALAQLLTGANTPAVAADLECSESSSQARVYHCPDRDIGIWATLHLAARAEHCCRHVHRAPCTTRVLSGSLRHEWYARTDVPGSSGLKYLTHETAGSAFTILPGVAHLLLPTTDTVTLALGPSRKADRVGAVDAALLEAIAAHLHMK